MKKKIEIVSHAFSGHLRQYAAFLALQCESLVRNHGLGRWDAGFTVFTSTRDREVIDIFQRYSKILLDVGVEPQLTLMEKPFLLKRCYGRNIVAKSTQADVVWFADVDYWFGAGCLPSVVSKVTPKSGLTTPDAYYCHQTHTLGDILTNEVLAELDAGRLAESVKLDPTTFYRRPNNVAIGGIQIIGAKMARKIGYLDRNFDWLTPKEGEELDLGVARCKDDVAWRRRNALGKRTIPVSNLFRFRHSVAGHEVVEDRVE